MQGKPYAGNPHVRFDEGAGVPRHSRRSALLYNIMNTLAVAVSGAAFLVSAAVPNVTDVTMTQADNRLVTINYTLSDAPAVITVDVQTNDNNGGWASIGGEALWNAVGDVWKKVEAGETVKTITWRPDHTWPDHKIEGNNTRAVVTAWALDNTPDYMVVDLTVQSGGDNVRYYPGVEFLPKKNFDQKGTAILGNEDYRKSKLVMRKIMARGVQWTMGSVAADEPYERGTSEDPHLVALTNNYYIGVFEITQKQYWYVVPGQKHGYFKEVNWEMRPMDNPCYDAFRLRAYTASNREATAEEISSYSWPKEPHPDSFLGKLRAKTGLDFDMPSDAQWEFACRAGNGSGYWNDGSKVLNTHADAFNGADANLDNLACYRRSTANVSSSWDTNKGTMVVGSYKPNGWGLYDMHGNVWEFCLDWAGDNSELDGKVNIDPADPSKTLSGETGANRVSRGGAWCYGAPRLRSSYRFSRIPGENNYMCGIRVVCTSGLQ